MTAELNSVETKQTNVNVEKTSTQKPENKKFDRKSKSNTRSAKIQKDDFEEKVVAIRRVTKVTKGGRHFRFAAVVVVGNKKGLVGMGTGKANEVPEAIKKAIKEAKKNLVVVPLRDATVPHEIIGTFGAGKILIKPAKAGTGVIAGGPARAVIELAGISDVYAKSLGSNNPINMIRATMKGLQSMQTLKRVNELRYLKTIAKEVKVVGKQPEKLAEKTVEIQSKQPEKPVEKLAEKQPEKPAKKTTTKKTEPVAE